MISIGVVDQHSFTRDCVSRSLKAFDDDLEVMPFESSEDCLKRTSTLDVILYHEHEDNGDGDETRLDRLRKLSEICPVIILSAADNQRSITEAFENGVRGYIPTASTAAVLMT